ncbi:MAG: 50S ribosomal protein L10 [Candidatus Omnitrophica bacterium]|nr:50S ribosomal protein L10 [Candidatus Omnitrophota bacterium]MDD5512929.1 50S ribosomal protein L10 [Candidatus Omnitrophota bacterium]
MKKVGILFKEASESHIKEQLKGKECFFVIKYSGLSSPDLTALRMSLKDSRADFFVVKNSVARRALKNSGLESVVKSIEGPCGIVVAGDEPVEASKVLFNFKKEHEKMVYEAGFLQDRILEAKDIEALAKLPSRHMLHAQLAMTLKSPINNFVYVLKNTLKKFVICVEQIKEKKEKEQGGKNG